MACSSVEEQVIGAQFVGVAAAFIFVFATSFIVFKAIDLTIGMSK